MTTAKDPLSWLAGRPGSRPDALVNEVEMSRKGWIIFALFFLSLASQAQQWSGILNGLGPNDKNVSQSAIDWSAVGIPGGIPSGGWTQCGSTIQASTYGNGSIDATSGIQSALRACGANGFVLLSAGTFLVNSAGAGSPTLSIPSNVALRGAGANQTILNSTGSNGGGIIMLGSGVDVGEGYGTNNPVTNSVSITSGAVGGSTSIVVSSAANFAVGGELLISETNDPNYVTINGGSGPCTFCDGFWNGARSRGQIVEITSIKGTTIGITPGLYTAYTISPQALYFMPNKYSGVEDLQVISNNSHTANLNQTFSLYTCAYCWLKGVEANYTDGDYYKVYWGFRDEIRDSYFTNGYDHGPGQNNNGGLLYFKSTACLIENNIYERSENPLMLTFGPAGNVFAYNYAVGSWGIPGTLTVPMIETHSAHAQFNLFEGNVGSELWLDVGHGSTSQQTSFRNWYLGTSFVCSPASDPSDSSKPLVNCSGSSGNWSTDATRSIADDSISTYENFVGDILGSASQPGAPGSAILQWPANRPYNGTGSEFGMTFGYTLMSDSGNNSMDDTSAFATSFTHGVYNNINNTTTWVGGVTQALPASFFLGSQPSWWTKGVPFPSIGPDIKGGVGPGGHIAAAYANPAMNCYYTTMNGVEGGAGSPLTFNADSCYPSQSVVVNPPTGLSAVVQ